MKNRNVALTTSLEESEWHYLVDVRPGAGSGRKA